MKSIPVNAFRQCCNSMRLMSCYTGQVLADLPPVQQPGQYQARQSYFTCTFR